MLRRILANSRLAVILGEIDFQIAEELRSGGCPHCGAALHSARYPRKPRCMTELGGGWLKRDSFCCAVCRRRATPASVRFLGRKIYPGVVVVLLTALCHGATARRVRVLRTALGVDRRTLERWRAWWRETFPETDAARTACARWLPPLNLGALPRSFFERLGGIRQNSILTVLRILLPLTTSLPDRLCRGST